MQSKRSDSIDSATTTGVAARLLGLSAAFSELHLHQLRCEEPPWHAELRTSFVTLYMQYLQQPGAGFQQIQVLPATSDASTSQRYARIAVPVLQYSLSTSEGSTVVSLMFWTFPEIVA